MPTTERERTHTTTAERVADSTNDLIRFLAEPAPWAARTYGNDKTFRGRLRPGVASLPAQSSAAGSTGLTVGLASRAIILRSVGVAYPIPAHVPWVVLPNIEWRLVTAEATDLRLVLTHEVRRELIGATTHPNRPIRLDGRESKVARAAIKAATPVWVDHRTEPVADLAVRPNPGWTLVGQQSGTAYHRDEYNTFLMMMTWAFEQRNGASDPRLSVVAEYIKSRLADPTLNTNSIAEQLRISRRSLQALFEEEGGVASFIRRRRLATALQLLTQDADHVPDLDTVATLAGLGSRRTLERAMRQVYGLTPSQARSHLLAGKLLRQRQVDDLAS